MKNKKIAALICSVLLMAGCVLSLFENVYSGDPKVDPAWDTAEGRILTSDGTVICECRDDEHRGTVADPEAYGSLVGFNSSGYGRSDLRARLTDTLYATEKRKPKQGNSVSLTLNHSVQTFAYDLMKPFSTAGSDTNACAVCIENDTGRIVGLVSIKAPLKTEKGEIIPYDVNQIGSFYRQVKENGIEIPEAYFLPEWAMPQTPGSVFKCFAAVPIIENGLDQLSFLDQGSITVGTGVLIKNYGGYSYGEIRLNGALKYSSNIFFAWMYANNLSKGDLGDIYDRCLLGTPLNLDFTELNSTVNLHDFPDYIMSSFGQITAVTPLQTCSLLSGICAGTGTVKKPFLIEKEITPKDKSKEVGKESVLTEITDSETASKLRSYLQETAANYGYNDGVYMKTGTAEIDGGVQNYCFCGNMDYTVLISVHNYSNSSHPLKEAAHSLLRYTTSACLDFDNAQDAYARPLDD